MLAGSRVFGFVIGVTDVFLLRNVFRSFDPRCFCLYIFVALFFAISGVLIFVGISVLVGASCDFVVGFLGSFDLPFFVGCSCLGTPRHNAKLCLLSD